jgi:hypothetical protein
MQDVRVKYDELYSTPYRPSQDAIIMKYTNGVRIKRRATARRNRDFTTYCLAKSGIARIREFGCAFSGICGICVNVSRKRVLSDSTTYAKSGIWRKTTAVMTERSIWSHRSERPCLHAFESGKRLSHTARDRSIRLYLLSELIR